MYVLGFLFGEVVEFPPSVSSCTPKRGHSREILVEVCRRCLQIPTLFKSKIVHFATLFKTRDLISRPTLNHLVSHTELSNQF